MQHYKALVYYGRYLRAVAGEFFSGHGLVIPQWDFSIGEGSDILGTLNYYVIGDPFAFFSVFIPTRFMHFFYGATVLLRMYLAGLAFSWLCFFTGQDNRYGVLAGALTYVFCFWAILNSVRHPYFLNPLLYFPLLILGVEKLLKKRRPDLFIVAVFLAAVSNFYFFYMLAILTALYAVLRICFLYRGNIRSMCGMVLRVGMWAVPGVLLAAVMFLPACAAFLGDARMSSDTVAELFYPCSYYERLPALFVSEGFPKWSCMGFAAPALPAVVFLFSSRKKEYSLLKALFLICVAMFMLPLFGFVLNGFSYAANRWSFAFALLCAYILTAVWPSLMEPGQKEAKALAVCMAFYWLYFAALLLSDAGKLGVLGNLGTSAAIASVFVLLLYPAGHKKGFVWGKRKQRIGILLVMLGVFNVGCWHFLPVGGDYLKQMVGAEQISKKLGANETAAVKRAAGQDKNDGFYRYSGSGLTRNANMIAGLSSTQFYWTLSNPYMTEFKRALEVAEPYSYIYEGYGSRAALLSLSSVGYYAAASKEKGNTPVPYGFSHVDASGGRYEIYRNDYALPLCYTYDTYMTREHWEQLSAVDKQDALLQSLVLEEGCDGFQEGSLEFEGMEIPYTAVCKGGVKLQGNAFAVKSKKSSVTLKFNGSPGCESYVSIKGLSFQDPPDKKSHARDVRLNMKSSLHTERALKYLTKYSPRYMGRDDFTIDFGYSEKKVTSVTIRFSDTGVYSFDSIHVFCHPMERYGAWIAGRKADAPQHFEFAPNTVSFAVSADRRKLICLSIPFAKGWRAFVDGEEAPLMRANVQYMALALDAGEHEIRLAYATPLLREGACISALAAAVLAAAALIRKRKAGGAGEKAHAGGNADYTEEIYRIYR